ncbi:hypothetical protein SRRS_36850 [Sporomusa rhizae]|uniref:DoxX family protein n=1 Tax=Sporomusa rhizae TaxID=357999 RepID=UPI00352BC81F
MKQFLRLVSCILSRYRDLGLLLFRLGLGGMFMWHGWPKISGGVEKWTGLGKTMGIFGVEFAPGLWGFMSSFAEFGGGLLFALGLFYRPACFLLFSNMFIAYASQMIDGKGLQKASQALEDGISFFGAAFVGPGKYSIDHLLGFEEDTKETFRNKLR